MSAVIRLEDLRILRRAIVNNPNWRDIVSIDPVTASEVASVLSDAELLGELVRRGVLTEKNTPFHGSALTTYLFKGTL